MKISQMTGYLGSFPNACVFGQFPKCLGILEISSHLRNLQNIKNIPPSNICRYLVSFSDTLKFPKSLGFWEIPIFDDCCHSLKIRRRVPLRRHTKIGRQNKGLCPKLILNIFRIEKNVKTIYSWISFKENVKRNKDKFVIHLHISHYFSSYIKFKYI